MAKKEPKQKAGGKQQNPLVRFALRIRRWFREMKSELKKVQWPSVRSVRNNTLIVLACVLIVGVFIWAFDWLSAQGAQGLITLFNR